jgi:kojibiose phosphorylase
VRCLDGDRQIHVNADVPYGFWTHHLATGERELLFGPALEIFIETARYWASRVMRTRTPAGPLYELRDVVGPDEYHVGVDNSVYTSAMARWNLRKALDLLDEVRRRRPSRYAALARRFRLTAKEGRQWQEIADHLKINFDPATGLYEQFDGYFQLADKTIKQADVLLMLYLHPEMRTQEIFLRNFEYYYPVTRHGSSLSPCMHVLFGLDVGRKGKAYDFLVQACEVDGIRRNDGSDSGLHAASLGGGWTAIVAGFGGVRVMSDHLRVAPGLPKKWRRLAFSICYRGLRLRFRIEPRRLTIRADRDGPAVPLDILGERRRIGPGEKLVRLMPRNDE